jgi:wyosine [tRNA(Phe)-imidazoG37] synthetase (radical SAM superfamily)
LNDPLVRHDLLAADAVLPSLDAGSEDLFLRINRPHPGFRFAEHVAGLVEFRREYDGKLWVEVMLIRGLNDSDQALADLAAVLSDIGPDEVHIVLPVRPPCQSWVRPASEERQMCAVATLGNAARLIPPQADTAKPAGTDVADAVLAVISRHPLRDEEILSALARWSPAEIDEALALLRDRGAVQVVSRFGQRFWSHAGSHYGQARCRRSSNAVWQRRRFHRPGWRIGRGSANEAR